MMETHRFAIIQQWSDEDNACIAEVPGCAADGATHAEGLQNVEILIREWIETATELGRPIPLPKRRLLTA